MTDKNKEQLQVVSRVLYYSWVIGFVAMGLMFVATQLASGLIATIHGSLFGLSPHEISVIIYCSLGLMKFALIIFFFIPWLSLKCVMARGMK